MNDVATPKIAREEHEIAFREVCALVEKHAEKVSAAELLAVAANMIGKLVALQDRHTMTPAKAMEIVMRNLEIGNAQAVGHLAAARGTVQ